MHQGLREIVEGRAWGQDLLERPPVQYPRRLIQDFITKSDYPAQLLGLLAGARIMKSFLARTLFIPGTLVPGTLIQSLAAICVAAPAFAADLPARAYSKAPAMASPVSVYDWSGFYVGANVGGTWDNGTATNVALNGTFVSSGSAHNSGVIGGGQIGYNYMVSPGFLLGIEADVDGTSLKGSVLSLDGSNQHSSKLDAFGTVRGRAGFAENNWLFYGTGGFAWSEGSVTRTQITTVAALPPIPAVAGTVETASNTRTGWAAGAGVEWGITQNWTARVEYLYLDLGNATSVFPLSNRQQTSSLTMNVARVGVSYKFGGPVAAWY
jgi:outer membrane immunogenic protein